MAEQTTDAANHDGASADGHKPPAKLIVLVRHGQTTFNVEGRLPGQMPGVPLTDEGRRQAHQAAVALALVPLTSVVSSPLERARDTAEIIARGFGLPVRLDARLMDTDIPRWQGKTIAEVAKSDPGWKEYLAHPTEPPEGAENMDQVQARVVAAVEQIRADPEAGNYIVVVAHADVVKLAVGHYLGMHIKSSLSTHIANASLSAFVFEGDGPPHLLTLNWTPSPGWLTPPLPKPESAPSAAHAPQGAVPMETSNVGSDAPAETQPA
jgi:probable phosphoglycerate mutase